MSGRNVSGVAYSAGVPSIASRTLSRKRKAVLAIAAALLLLSGVIVAQDKTFRVNVKLVHMLATVKDNYGKPVANLTRDDFDIYDNGAKQSIRLFETHMSQPLSVATMIDISGSTAKDLKYETVSLNRFFRALFRQGNPDDTSALYSFNWEVREVCGYTRDETALDRRMKGLKAEAGTAMYDAIYLAARAARDREGRRVMVVVTDGGDTTSGTSYQQALKALHNADMVFYAILVMPITNDAGRNIGGENALTTLANSTGGKVFVPSLGLQMDEAFDEILRDLRTQYLIGFYPTDVPLTKDPFHHIEIRPRASGLRVIARTGYYGDFIRE